MYIYINIYIYIYKRQADQIALGHIPYPPCYLTCRRFWTNWYPEANQIAWWAASDFLRPTLFDLPRGAQAVFLRVYAYVLDLWVYLCIHIHIYINSRPPNAI